MRQPTFSAPWFAAGTTQNIAVVEGLAKKKTAD
jgi:hypothetical protein